MSHRVVALYADAEKAHLAAGDLQSAGVPLEHTILFEGRLEVRARDLDHALNVQAFLREDGAEWAEIVAGTDDAPPRDAIPPVPAPS